MGSRKSRKCWDCERSRKKKTDVKTCARALLLNGGENGVEVLKDEDSNETERTSEVEDADSDEQRL